MKRSLTTRRRVVLAAVIVLAAAARAGFGIGVVGLDTRMPGDESDYQAIAVNLASGSGFADASGQPTGRRPPAWPFVMSLLYRAIGPNVPAARVLQMLLGVLLVGLTFVVARRYFDEDVGLVAAGLAAVNPFLVFISGYLLTENLYTVLLLGALASVPLRAPGEWARWVIAGLLLGLATLTRPTGLPVALWIGGGWLVCGSGAVRTRVARATVLVGLAVLVTVPWMLRNQAVAGGWVGLTTNGGLTFYQGNNEAVLDEPHYRGGVAPLDALPHFTQLAGMDERAGDRAAYRFGLRFLRDHWRRVPEFEWWKFARMWRLRSDMGMSGIRSGWWFDTHSTLGALAARLDAGFLYAVLVFPLFLVGLFLTRARWRDLVPLYGIVAVHTAIGLVFYGSIRMRLPIEPVIASFAAAAAVTIIARVRSGGMRTTRSAPGPEAP